MTLHLAQIGVNDLRHVWDAMLPLIERACEHTDDEMTPQMVCDGVLEGRLGLLCLHDGTAPQSIMVVCVVPLPNAPPRMEVLAVSGSDMAEWMPFEGQLDRLAATYGCDRVRAKARPGMAKKLPHWKLKSYVLERMIEDGRTINA